MRIFFLCSMVCIAMLQASEPLYVQKEEGHLDLSAEKGFVFNALEDVTHSGALSGTGPLIKMGQGTLTLKGENRFTGDVEILVGALRVFPKSLNQDVINHGELIFHQISSGSYGGAISGRGSIIKEGKSSLRLEGKGLYTGNTTLAAGVLETAHSDAFGTGSLIFSGGSFHSLASFAVQNGCGFSAADGIFKVDPETDLTLAGDIWGEHGLIKQGPGTLRLAGPIRYQGNTEVLEGTLEIQQETLSSPSIENAARLVFDLKGDMAFDGKIASSGVVVKKGKGSLKLLKGSSHFNSVEIWEGALEGKAALFDKVQNKGKLIFLEDEPTTFSGTIVGDGVLVKKGAGFLSLQNPLYSPGSLQILEGALIVDTEKLQCNASNDAELIFDQARRGNYLGEIEGPGSLEKRGEGLLSLEGMNRYSGKTILSEGSLEIFREENLGDPSSLLELKGGTFRVATNLSLQRPVDISQESAIYVEKDSTLKLEGHLSGTSLLKKQGLGALDLYGGDFKGQVVVEEGSICLKNYEFSGDIETRSDLIFDEDERISYAGNLSGKGRVIKRGKGKITLLGNNSWEGLLQIDEGILESKSSSLPSHIVNEGSLIFHEEKDGSYFGKVEGSGPIFKVGPGTLNLHVEHTDLSKSVNIFEGALRFNTENAFREIANWGTVIFDQKDRGVYSGKIQGKGALIKEGPGDLALLGEQFYEGGTKLIGGVLEIESDSNLGKKGSFLEYDGGVLRILQSDKSARPMNILSRGGVEIVEGAEWIFQGALKGQGEFEKRGKGSLFLKGTSSFAGKISILEGYVEAQSSSISGDIENRGQLVFNQIFSEVFPGNITGTGDFCKQGEGVLVIPSFSQKSGNIKVLGGSLCLTIDDFSGSILNQGQMSFYQLRKGVCSGSFSGEGAFIKEGPGALLLTGENSCVGTTLLKQGTLEVASHESLGKGPFEFIGGTLRILDGFTFQAPLYFSQKGTVFVNRDVEFSLEGDLIGPGDFEKAGHGIFYLQGQGLHEGRTIISGGSFATRTEHFSKDIENHGNVIFTNDTRKTYPGVISGSGSFEKRGKGTFCFLQKQRYQGVTFLKEGKIDMTSDQLSSEIEIGQKGHLLFRVEDPSIFREAIRGEGNLEKIGYAELVLEKAEYSGITFVNGGILRVKEASLLGDIRNNEHFIFDQARDGEYSGTIFGKGTFEKCGKGTLSLSRDNHFEGEMYCKEGAFRIFKDMNLGNLKSSFTFAGGGLQMSGTFDSDREFFLRGEGTICVDSSCIVTLNRGIQGDGFLSKKGLGTLAFKEGDLWKGRLQIDEGSCLVNAAHLVEEVNLRGNLVFDQQEDGVYLGKITGSGALFKRGPAALTLVGENRYFGGTYIEEGILRCNAKEIVGSVWNEGTLIFDQKTGAIFEGGISGSGIFRKEGDQALSLTGKNDFRGKVEVISGELRVNTESLVADVENRSILVFDEKGEGTYCGSVEGEGIFVKEGPGILHLKGRGNDLKEVILREGVLSIDSNQVLGRRDQSLIFEGGALGIESDLTFDKQMNLCSPGIFSVAAGKTLTLKGKLEGEAPLIKEGEGSLVLESLKRFGPIVVKEGVLIADARTFLTKVQNDAQVVLNQEISSGLQAMMCGSGVWLKKGKGTLTISDPSTYSGVMHIMEGALCLKSRSFEGDIECCTQLVLDSDKEMIYSGALSGQGKLVKKGKGFSTFTKGGSFVGKVEILEGVLTVHDPMLSEEVANSAYFCCDMEHSGVYKGSISGPGVFIKRGPGTLVLDGDSSYTGGTDLLEGRLEVYGERGLGSVEAPLYLKGGTYCVMESFSSERPIVMESESNPIFVNEGKEFQLMWGITGKGDLIKEGLGTLYLNSRSNYEGRTVVKEGALRFLLDELGENHFVNQSPILNLGELIISHEGSLSLGQEISGTGDIVKEGKGQLTIANARDCFGQLIVCEGEVALKQSCGMDVINRSTVFLAPEDEMRMLGKITGEGTLVKKNQGTAMLLGKENTVRSIVIEEGTLGVLADSLDSDVVNHADFILEGGGNFASNVQGSGKMYKKGRGVLVVSSEITQELFSVEEGALSLNSLCCSDIIVQRGAALRANEELWGDVTNHGSAFLKRSKIFGDYTQTKEGAFHVELEPEGGDCLEVEGNLCIENESSLYIHLAKGVYPLKKVYRIVGFGGESTGRFGEILSTNTSYYFSLLYGQNSLEVQLLFNSLHPFIVGEGNRNAEAVALDFDVLETVAGIPADLLNQINLVQSIGFAPSTARALDQMHPAPFSNLTNMEKEVGAALGSFVLGRLDRWRGGQCCLDRRAVPEVWGDVFYQYLSQDNVSYFAGADSHSEGGVFGVDYNLTKELLLGVYGACVNTDVSFNKGRGSGDLLSGYFGIYGGAYRGAFSVKWTGAGFYAGVDAERKIDFLTTKRVASSDHGLYGVYGNIEVDYSFLLLKQKVFLSPFFRTDGVWCWESSFSETGADGLNLVVDPHNSNYFRVEGGLMLGGCPTSWGLSHFYPEVKLSWVGEYFPKAVNYDCNFEGTEEKFFIYGLNKSRSLVAVSVYCNHQFLEDRLTLRYGYSGEFGASFTNQVANVQVGYQF